MGYFITHKHEEEAQGSPPAWCGEAKELWCQEQQRYMPGWLRVCRANGLGEDGVTIELGEQICLQECSSRIE